MDQAAVTASPRLRVIFLAVASSMLFLWGWSLVPPIQNWNSVFYATMICLPTGLFLLIGAIAGRGQHVVRARSALFVGCGTLLIVVAFLIFQQIANSTDGLG